MGRKTSPKKTDVAARRARVAKAYLRGVTQQEIASLEAVNQATISRDLKALRSEWQESALVDIDTAKSQELARIDELERTYWREWEESKEIHEVTTTKQTEVTNRQAQTSNNPGDKRIEASVRKEDRLGDPRYLSGVQWCINRRIELLGLDAPTRTISDTTLRGGVNVTHRTDPGEYQRALSALADALGTGIPGTGSDRHRPLDATEPPPVVGGS